MKVLVCDIETNGLDNPDKLHCVSLFEMDLRSGGCNPLDFFAFSCSDPEKSPSASKALQRYFDRYGRVVFHNGIGYDVPVLESFGFKVNHNKVWDTFVISRLADYKGLRTHSLDEWGERLKFSKGEQPKDWEHYTPEMGIYCKRDVLLTCKVLRELKPFIFNPQNKQALTQEHEAAWISSTIKENGHSFNVRDAVKLQKEIQEQLDAIEEEFQKEIKPKLKEVKRLVWKKNKDGSLPASLLTNMANPDYTFVIEEENKEVVFYEYVKFNPGSAKQRVAYLNESGWQPTDKTKGHIEAEREVKRIYYKAKKRLPYGSA